MLGNQIQRHFGQIQIGADARGSRDAGGLPHIRHDAPRQLPGAQAIQLQIGRDVQESLIDGIHMDIPRGDIAKIDAIDVRRRAHIQLHAGQGRDISDRCGDFKDTAAIAHAQRFHLWRDSQADRSFAPRWVCDHQRSRKRVQPALHTFH